MKYDVATPYTAAHVILNKNGKIAFVLRHNTNWGDGYYGLLSGKVDHGESYLQAATREAKEEAGVTIRQEDLSHVLTAHRKSSASLGDSDESLWVDVVFMTKKWQGKAYNAEPHKHLELVWLDPKNLPDNVVPPILFYLDQIASGKSYAEYGWTQ